MFKTMPLNQRVDAGCTGTHPDEAVSVVMHGLAAARSERMDARDRSCPAPHYEPVAPSDRTAALGDACVSGAFWTAVCAIASKVIALGGHIVLAWFLLPDDVGLAAMAFAIIGFASLLSADSLGNVLVQQTESFDRNVGQVFWLSLFLHVAATVVLCLLAPLGALVLGEPRIIPLIIIHALCWPFSGLTTVYQAVLIRDLRGRTLAIIRLVDVVINTGGAVVLAAQG
jgi:PST family polysaccharide transporter